VGFPDPDRIKSNQEGRESAAQKKRSYWLTKKPNWCRNDAVRAENKHSIFKKDQPLLVATLSAPKTRLEEEKSELAWRTNFLSTFLNAGRINYETKMVAAGRDPAVTWAWLGRHLEASIWY
jgi:hypothetical protein